MFKWRALDQENEVLDVPLQQRRNKRAARRLLRKLLRKYDNAPDEIVTDGLASYGAALETWATAHDIDIARVDCVTITERRIRISQCDDESARCSASNRRAKLSASSPPTAPPIISSTFNVT